MEKIRKPDKPLTDEQKKRKADRIREKRAEAKAAGIKLSSDSWAERNPEKHYERTRKWRLANKEKALGYVRKWQQADVERWKAVNRKSAAKRRATPWGHISSTTFGVLRKGVQRNSRQPGKYNFYLGYVWSDLRAHLEAQFSPEMNWDNWGSVWEIDHIKPISVFRYESLDCPTYKEAWALSNLRPLPREVNATKAARIAE